ncbi:MAG: hypothetical protein AB8G95_07005 [Anaerolineae bacterium]
MDIVSVFGVLLTGIEVVGVCLIEATPALNAKYAGQLINWSRSGDYERILTRMQ